MDPVRYISNESSGKQGYEIALALNRMGVNTTLITGPSNIVYNREIKTKKIVTAEEMLEEVKKALPADMAVCVAAVSDFKPIWKSKKKLKKDKNEFTYVELEKNTDII